MKLQEMFNSFVYKTPIEKNPKISVLYNRDHDNWEVFDSNNGKMIKVYDTKADAMKKAMVENPKQIMYDFYFLVGYVYGQDFSMTRKGADYSLVSGYSENINFIFNEAVKDCVDQLTVHMCKAMKFALSAEFKHITDYSHFLKDLSGLPKEQAIKGLKEAVSENTYKFIVEYLDVFPKFYSSSGAEVPKMFTAFSDKYDVDRKNYRGATKQEPGMKYDNQYRAVIVTQKNTGLSDLELSDVFIEMFGQDKGWASQYGGVAWKKIATAYKRLLSAESTQDKIVWCDHAYDLQHNTGTMFNKLQGYYNNGYEWIKGALDWKRDNTSIKAFYDLVSPQLKPIVAYVAKHGGEGSLIPPEQISPHVKKIQDEVTGKEKSETDILYDELKQKKEGDFVTIETVGVGDVIYPAWKQKETVETYVITQINHEDKTVDVMSMEGTKAVLPKFEDVSLENKSGKPAWKYKSVNTKKASKEEEAKGSFVTIDNVNIGDVIVYAYTPDSLRYEVEEIDSEANKVKLKIIIYDGTEQSLWKSLYSAVSNKPVFSFFSHAEGNYAGGEDWKPEGTIYDPSNNSSKYEVGTLGPGGGYVFAEGLEAYPYDAPKNMQWEDAKKWCSNLGHGWRLPTKEELNLMYTNLKKANLGGFSGSWLWSSSQYSVGNGAWVQRFSDGSQYGSYKYNGYSVRACRAF